MTDKYNKLHGIFYTIFCIGPQFVSRHHTNKDTAHITIQSLNINMK